MSLYPSKTGAEQKTVFDNAATQPTLKNANGPVLVTGLPRSGTTTTAATFATHPDLSLYKSGAEKSRLECAELLPEGSPDFEKIRILHTGLNGTRLLVKRPWLHLRHRKLLQTFIEETGARVIISLRDIAGIRQSWMGRGRRYIKDKDRQNLDQIYAEAIEAAFELERDGLACTTWLPFLSVEKHPTEIRRLEIYAGLQAGHMSFKSKI